MGAGALHIGVKVGDLGLELLVGVLRILRRPGHKAGSYVGRKLRGRGYG